MSKLELNKLKKENALYNTAFELFTTKGMAKTTISDIVEMAGVAKGTFYLYFKDKYDIRNKLVAHKTAELFEQAGEAMAARQIEGFVPQIHFLVDFMLEKLQANTSLLIFISKNLSWGVFKGIFEDKNIRGSEFDFYEAYLNFLSQDSSVSYDHPELLLFTILELVSGTCHSCILYQQPVSMDEYRPYLHRSIDAILKGFEIGPDGTGAKSPSAHIENLH